MTSIEGNRGEPRPRPPFPAHKGLWGKPTRAEQRRDLRQRAADHPQRRPSGYAAHGTEKSKGTKVFALAGTIKNTGLVEVPVGMPLGDLIYDIGGGIPGGKEFKAAQIGGPSGGCIPKQHLNVPLDYESLSELGAIMGSGGLIVMDEDSCMVDVARFFLEFVQEESCGKCVALPRRHQADAGDPQPHLRGPGRGGRRRAADRAGRDDQGHVAVRPGPDGAQPGALDDPPLRPRVRGAHPRQALPGRRLPGAVQRPCSSACPANVDIPGYVSLVGEKRYAEALRLHRERNPFAAICSRVCFHTCEDKCRRADVDAPVSIRGIKRFMVDQEVTIQTARGPRERRRTPARKIAIVGAGPAGPPCAYFLARLGYQPTVFEAEPRPAACSSRRSRPTACRARSSPARSA